LGLEPVGVAGVVGLLIKPLGGVAVKNRATEGDTGLAVAVAAARAVAAREHELELAAARFAEEGDRGAGETAVAGVVVVELAPDLLLVLLAVQAVEDLAHQVLLVRVEQVAQALGHDVPVVVDLEPARIVVGEAESLALGFVEAAV